MSDVRWYRRLSGVSDNIDRFGFTMCDATSDDIITEQKGVFRTNCLDWYESGALYCCFLPPMRLIFRN